MCIPAETVQTIGVLVASLTAIYGINAWQRELSGKRRYELAEEVLALFYEAKDIIISMRCPMGSGGEGISRKPSQNEDPDEKKARDRAYVPFERYEAGSHVFARLRALRYRFMAVFGQDKSRPFEDIRHVTNEIFTAAHMLSQIWARHDSRPEDTRRLEAVFWQSDEKDPTALKVDAAVSEMESICKPLIEKSSEGLLRASCRKLKGILLYRF